LPQRLSSSSCKSRVKLGHIAGSWCCHGLGTGCFRIQEVEQWQKASGGAGDFPSGRAGDGGGQLEQRSMKFGMW